MKRFNVLVLVVVLLASLEARAQSPRVDSFRPISQFLVPDAGSAEIVAATPAGNILVYANSVKGKVGIVSLADIFHPVQEREVLVDGEPTSVAVTPDGRYVVVALNTAKFTPNLPPVETPGRLLILDIETGALVGSVLIGGGPDAVKVAQIDGETVAVVAIENEPILVNPTGGFVAGDAPGQPNDVSQKGLVQVVTINWESIVDSHVAEIRFDDEAALAALGLTFPADPQPEYVDIRNGKAAVTLQENNAIAIIDISDPRDPVLDILFSTGVVADRPADLLNNAEISFSQLYPSSVATRPFAGARMADAIAWNATGTALFTADEGELNFTGGRGFSAWTPAGAFLWDDGGGVEAQAVKFGHYPQARSAARGVEMEGIDTGRFGRKEFAFAASERGGFVAVYNITNPLAPVFVQLLATGLRPEGVLALPERNLLVTSEEGDGGNGSMTIFQGVPGLAVASAREPIVRSSGVNEPWAALSSLAADPFRDNVLYSVPDNALPSTVFRIARFGGIAKISPFIPITKGGVQMKYDLEGISIDSSILATPRTLGFWLASEGNAAFGTSGFQPNVLIQVDATGAVLREIRLPEEVEPPVKPASADGKIRNNGYEGVCVSASGRYLLACIQREYLNEPAIGGLLHTRIARYDLMTDTWEFFLYPLDVVTDADDWMGLSEIIHLGHDHYAVIERDKLMAARAKVKLVYHFTLEGVEPTNGPVTSDMDLSGRVIQKHLLRDVLAKFSPFEKVEGLAYTISRALWAVLDNDGGLHETKLVHLGEVDLDDLDADHDHDDDDKDDK